MDLQSVIAQKRLQASAPIDAVLEELKQLDASAQALLQVSEPPMPDSTERLELLRGLSGSMLLFAVLMALIGSGTLAVKVLLPVYLGTWALITRQSSRARSTRGELHGPLALQARCRRLDTHRLGAAAVLRLLAPDLSHAAPCTLDLDLDPEPRDTVRHNGQPVPRGWLTRRTARWLTASGVLADGSRFQLRVFEHMQHVERGRATPKGRKIKRVVSEQGVQVRLVIWPRRGRYPGLEGAVAAQPARALPLGVVGGPVSMKGKTLRVAVLAPVGAAAKQTDAVAAAFFSLYDRLGAAQPPGETP